MFSSAHSERNLLSESGTAFFAGTPGFEKSWDVVDPRRQANASGGLWDEPGFSSRRDINSGELLRSDEFERQGCEFNIFAGRKATDRDGAGDGTIFPDGKTSAPADESGIAVVGDVVSFFGMPNFLSDVLGGLSLASSGPGFVGRDSDRGDGRAIHAGESDELAVRIGDRYDDGFLHLCGFVGDEVDNLLGF